MVASLPQSLSAFFLHLQEHLQESYKTLEASRAKKDTATLAATKANTKAQAELRAAKEAAAAERERIKQENKAAAAAATAGKPSWQFESQDFYQPPLQRRTSARLSAPSPAAVLRRADSEPGEDSQESVGSRRKAASSSSSEVKRRKRPVIIEESTQELDEAEESDEFEESDEEEDESQASLAKIMSKYKMASEGSQDLD